MKMTRLIYPLIFAAALSVLGTGCGHKPIGLTDLHNPAPVGNNQDLSSQPFNPNVQPINSNTSTTPGGEQTVGGGNQPSPDAFSGPEDRQTLAGDTIHFKFDSATILGGEQGNIQAVANALKSDMNAKLRIEGNCDERGTEEYNRSLGERRALAAREELVKQGVDAQRIATQSFGKDKPADPGHDAAAWEKNRRDEFVLFHGR